MMIFKNRNSLYSKFGFSLMELMVVLGISGVTGMLIMNFTQSQSKRKVSYNFQDQISYITNIAGVSLAREDICTQSLTVAGAGTPALAVGAAVGNIRKPGIGPSILTNNETYGVLLGNQDSDNINLILSMTVASFETIGDNQVVGRVALNFTNNVAADVRVNQTRFVTFYGTNAGGAFSCQADFTARATTDPLERICMAVFNSTLNVGAEVPAAAATCPTYLRTTFENSGGSDFPDLRRALVTRICSDMNGTVSGDGMSCLPSYTTEMSCTNGVFKGIDNNGTAICDTSIAITRATSPVVTCNFNSYSWGSDCLYSNSETLSPGQSRSYNNMRNPATVSGSFTASCDSGGNVSYSNQTCSVARSCTLPSPATWGDGCSGTPSGGTTLASNAILNIPNTQTGYSGDINYRCNDGTLSITSSSCTNIGECNRALSFNTEQECLDAFEYDGEACENVTNPYDIEVKNIDIPNCFTGRNMGCSVTENLLPHFPRLGSQRPFSVRANFNHFQKRDGSSSVCLIGSQVNFMSNPGSTSMVKRTYTKGNRKWYEGHFSVGFSGNYQAYFYGTSGGYGDCGDLSCGGCIDKASVTVTWETTNPAVWKCREPVDCSDVCNDPFCKPDNMSEDDYEMMCNPNIDPCGNEGPSDGMDFFDEPCR